MESLFSQQIDGPVAWLTLNRPTLHNALNAELIAEFHRACQALAANREVRAVVLSGAGPSFCAGADLNWMQASLHYSHAENVADAAQLDGLLAALDQLPQVVIGRMHGAALGGGVGVLSCCDIVVASAESRFGLTEVRLGLIPAVIARFVVAKIGVGQARALFVSGRRFGAEEAQRLGLIHEIVAADELDGAVHALIKAVLHNGPAAITAAKALLRATQQLEETALRTYAIEAIAATRTSPEGQEGLRAFLEKRRPAWDVSLD